MAGRTVLTVDRVGGAEGESGFSSGGRAGSESRDLLPMKVIAVMVDRTCRRFANDIDWRYAPASWAASERGQSDSGPGCFMLTENDLALRAGGHVIVDIQPLTSQLKVTAGYYDPYFYPVVVCEKSMALSDLDRRKLREVLDEAHDKLTAYYVRRAT